MEYTLRIAAAADFDAVNALFIEMLQSIYNKEDVEGYKPGDLDYYFSGNEHRIYLAECDSRTVGFLSVEVHREEKNYLYYDDFSVSRNYRGCGIGTALMEEAEKYCRELGFSAAALHVEKANERARRFYDRKGFSVLRDDGSRLCLVKDPV